MVFLHEYCSVTQCASAQYLFMRKELIIITCTQYNSVCVLILCRDNIQQSSPLNRKGIYFDFSKKNEWEECLIFDFWFLVHLHQACILSPYCSAADIHIVPCFQAFVRHDFRNDEIESWRTYTLTNFIDTLLKTFCKYWFIEFSDVGSLCIRLHANVRGSDGDITC